MLCCRDCPLETDATLTTVLFVDQIAQQRTHALQHYAEKHLKKMMARKEMREMQGNNKHERSRESRGNKENTKENNNKNSTFSAQKANIRNLQRLKDGCLYQSQRKKGEECPTGRFKTPVETSHKEYTHSHKHLQSKTTSFGSLATRNSCTRQFLQRAQLPCLQQQLQHLKQEEMSLLRQKLHRQYLYKKELSKVNGKRDDLSYKSKERQQQLLELRQLLRKKSARSQL